MRKVSRNSAKSRPNPDSFDAFFRNFANETRLGIIVALRDGPLNVTELAKRVGESQSTVSHSLKKLAECRILHVERDGKSRVYSLNEATVLPILHLAERHVRKNCSGTCAARCARCER